MELTQTQVNQIVTDARNAALRASARFFAEELDSQDQYACGFAWTNITVKGNTKLGRMLKAAGISRNDYNKCFQIWNPSGLGVQNVDCLYAGAKAAAEVFNRNNIPAYAGSRLD